MATKLVSNASSATLQVNGQDALIFNKGGSTSKVQSISCTQAGGELTFGLNPCVLDFRSTTLTTGTSTTRQINAALSLVLPSGGTLGSVTTVSARLILLAIDNAGTVELAVVNLSGGNDLSESGVINTTAIDTGSDSANVIYSTTARTGVAYRVVGAIDVVNTAGAWGTPTLVQGAGGINDISIALHAEGSAPMYACRAWVNFNGTGTVAIRASGNVSSITDNGIGDYTINFATAMPDVNYKVSASSSHWGSSSYIGINRNGAGASVPQTAGAVRLSIVASNSLSDEAFVNVSIFR